MSKHPIKTFRFRQYVAARSVLRLVIDYVLLVLASSAVLAAIAVIAAAPVNGVLAAFFDYFYMFGRELSGRDASLAGVDAYGDGSMLARIGNIHLGLAGVMLPALFLGTIVYKFFVLKRQNLVFRDHCYVTCADGVRCINVDFYIASRLKVNSLRFRAYVRLYRARNEYGRSPDLPMSTHQLTIPDCELILPYSYTPSRIAIPVEMPGQPEDRIKLCLGDGSGPIVVSGAMNATLHVDRKDFCELIVVAEGQVPEVQSSFCEIKTYQLPRDRKDGLRKMITQFDGHRFLTENWNDF